jgi:hypothetical protein
MNVNADEYAPYDSVKAREKSIAEKTVEYLKTRQQEKPTSSSRANAREGKTQSGSRMRSPDGACVQRCRVH